MKKISVVLFNLGGPESLGGVRSFLFNLFYDKAILNMPNPLRWLLAQFISRIRERKSIEIYKKLGGKSPILEQTQLQAKMLAEKLNKKYDSQVVIAMRCSSPFSFEIMPQIAAHQPEDIILLPLYPHFSRTTTNSSIEDFIDKMPSSLQSIKKRIICCYPSEEYFIRSHQNILRSFLANNDYTNMRLLISAHGLPKKNIEEGDPYVWQIETTCKEIMRDFPDIEWQLTYQSRVGPMEWTKPNTEDAIRGAALDKKDVLILPVSFVSEHSETLVELDIDYKDLAKRLGIKNFNRLPTLQVENNFLESLNSLCELALQKDQINPIEIYSQKDYRICPESYCKCVNEKNVN
jgi:ferrochelatase